MLCLLHLDWIMNKETANVFFMKVTQLNFI